MVIITLFLGLSTILLFKKDLHSLFYKGAQKITIKFVLISLIAAIILYIIFLLGGKASYQLGIGYLVLNIYDVLLSVNKIYLSITLIIIGIMEEIYWRGFVQGIFIDNNATYPWILSTIYYSIVHAVTFNYILVIAAFIVGLVTGYVAFKFGIVYSILTHIIWLEIVIVLFPVLP
jgi:membrane protease YdiL (CAAX protease family)